MLEFDLVLVHFMPEDLFCEALSQIFFLGKSHQIIFKKCQDIFKIGIFLGILSEKNVAENNI